jgi:hypothetical protein
MRPCIALCMLLICASTMLSGATPPAPESARTELLTLPSWLANPPVDGDYAIGIAYKPLYDDQTPPEAKIFAAVERARNRGSYAVAKHARVQSERSDGTVDETGADLEINVSADPPGPSVCDSMVAVDSLRLDAYAIALFRVGSETRGVPTPRRPLLTFDLPETSVEDGFVYVRVSSSSNEMIDAYRDAARLARLEAARYVRVHAHGVESSQGDALSRAWSEETTLRLNRMQITGIAVQRRLFQNVRSYSIALEMRMTAP